MTTISRLKQCLENIKYENKEINAILEMRDEKELIREAEEIDKKIKEKKAGVLAGKIICVKANICIEGMHTSCASKVLENYTATYDATVIKKIKQEFKPAPKMQSSELLYCTVYMVYRWCLHFLKAAELGSTLLCTHKLIRG